MGNTVSVENRTDDLVQVGVNVELSSLSTCKGEVDQSQVLSVTGQTGDINISNIDYTQYATLNVSCIQAQSGNVDVANQVTTAMTQAATSTLDSLGLPLNSAKASNVLRLTTQLASAVHIAMTNTCLGVIHQNQALVLANNTGNVNIVGVKFSQVALAIANCVQQNTAVVALKNQIQQELAQTAKAEITGLSALVKALTGPLALFLLAIVVLAGAGFLPKILGLTGPSKRTVRIGGIILGLIVLGVVIFWGISAWRKHQKEQAQAQAQQQTPAAPAPVPARTLKCAC